MASGGTELGIFPMQPRRRRRRRRARSFLRNQQILLASLSDASTTNFTLISIHKLYFPLAVNTLFTSLHSALTARTYPILERQPGTHCLGCITGRQTVQPEHMCFFPPPWPLSQDSLETWVALSPSRPVPLLPRAFVLAFFPSLPPPSGR